MRGEGRGERQLTLSFSSLTSRPSSLVPAAPSEPIRLPNPRPSRPEHRPIAFCVIDARFEATPRKTARIDRIRTRPHGRTPTLPRQKGAPVPPNGLRCPVRRSQRRRRRPRVNSFLECGGGQIQDASGFVKIAKGRATTPDDKGNAGATAARRRAVYVAAQRRRTPLCGLSKRRGRAAKVER